MEKLYLKNIMYSKDNALFKNVGQNLFPFFLFNVRQACCRQMQFLVPAGR